MNDGTFGCLFDSCVTLRRACAQIIIISRGGKNRGRDEKYIFDNDNSMEILFELYVAALALISPG